MSDTPGDRRVYCRECGEEIDPQVTYCPNCGEKQPEAGPETNQIKTPSTEQPRADPEIKSPPEHESSSRRWLDQYSMATWIGAVAMGLITFPVGLIIPLYFFIKAQGDEPPNQGTLEVVTVILWSILGMLAVEIGGERGAKALWGFLAIVIVFVFIVLLSL